MPDPVSRKKHKKKVLERWENEGGMIPDMPVINLQGGSPGDGGDCERPRAETPRPKSRRGKTEKK